MPDQPRTAFAGGSSVRFPRLEPGRNASTVFGVRTILNQDDNALDDRRSARDGDTDGFFALFTLGGFGFTA